MLPGLQGLDAAQGQAPCASPAQAQPAPHRTHSLSGFWGPWAAPQEQKEYTRPTVESSSQLLTSTEQQQHHHKRLKGKHPHSTPILQALSGFTKFCLNCPGYLFSLL